MLITISILLMKAGIVMAYGCCLGCGFALSKVVVDKVKMYSILLNPWKMKELKAEYQGA